MYRRQYLHSLHFFKFSIELSQGVNALILAHRGIDVKADSGNPRKIERHLLLKKFRGYLNNAKEQFVVSRAGSLHLDETIYS